MLKRVEQLEENIAYLKRMQEQFSLDDIKKNRFDEWALRYGLFESIQIVIDIACHISGKYNLGTAKTYVECIENLAKFKYIDTSLSKKLISAIGLRNLLIHEYIRIDIEKLYAYLSLRSDFDDFIREIRAYL